MCVYKERERKSSFCAREKPRRKCPLRARHDRHPKPPPPPEGRRGSLSSLYHQTARLLFQSVSFPTTTPKSSLRRDDDEEEADDDSQTLLLFFFFFFSRRCHLRSVPFPLFFFFVCSRRRRGKGGSNDNNVNIITTALEFQMHRPWVRPERGALRLLPRRTERRAGRKRLPKPVRERVLGVLQRERRG